MQDSVKTGISDMCVCVNLGYEIYKENIVLRYYHGSNQHLDIYPSYLS